MNRLPCIAVGAVLAAVIGIASAQQAPIFTDSFEPPGGGSVEKVCSGKALQDFYRVRHVSFLRNRYPDGGSRYDDVFNAWGISSSTIHLKLYDYEYVSLPFVIESTSNGRDDFAPLIWDMLASSPQSVRVVVSECEGFPNIDEAVQQPRAGLSCVYQGSGLYGALSMRARDGLTGCVLQAGKQYYLNVAYVNRDNQPACGRSRGCYWNVAEF